eukprot:scaffold3.g6605.t1
MRAVTLAFAACVLAVGRSGAQAEIQLQGCASGQQLHAAHPPLPPIRTRCHAVPSPATALFGTSLATGWPSSARLSDWSRAGYASASAAIPVRNDATIDARTIGARGDGVTDDTAALQRAINKAASTPGGGVVFLPAGTYAISSPLLVSGSGVVIRGQGMDKTTIYVTRALSDWKQGTWTIGPDGSFTGRDPVGSRITTVTAGAPRGSTRLSVASSAKLAVGDWVALVLHDPARAAAAAAGVAPPVKTVAQSQPAPGLTPSDAWLKDPVLYYALLAAWDSDDAGSAMSAAQQAALKASIYASLANPPKANASTDPSKAGAAAAPGTLTAWIYGDNLAYSGERLSQLADSARFAARVVATGKDATGKDWVEVDRPIPYIVKTAWQPELRTYRPSLQNSGVESLTMQMKWEVYLKHFAERGWNGITFINAANCWARSLRLLNCDNCLTTTGTDWTTFSNINVGVTQPRAGPLSGNTNGHHAIWLTRGQENLVEKSYVASRWVHDYSLEKYTTLNVFSGVGGVDVNLDNHRSASWANLFSAVNLGWGTRPFASGGDKPRGANAGAPAPRTDVAVGGASRRPSFGLAGLSSVQRCALSVCLIDTSRQLCAGAYQTFWNLTKVDGSPVQLPDCSFGPLLNFVGSYQGNRCGSMKWVVQSLQTAMPADLYRSMLFRRKYNERQAALKAPMSPSPLSAKLSRRL